MAQVNTIWVNEGDRYIEHWYYDQNAKDPEVPAVYYGAGYFYGAKETVWESEDE